MAKRNSVRFVPDTVSVEVIGVKTFFRAEKLPADFRLIVDGAPAGEAPTQTKQRKKNYVIPKSLAQGLDARPIC
jgi:hypothetical protein